MVGKHSKSVSNTRLGELMQQVTGNKRRLDDYEAYGNDLLNGDWDRWMLSNTLGSASHRDLAEASRVAASSRRKIIPVVLGQSFHRDKRSSEVRINVVRSIEKRSIEKRVGHRGMRTRYSQPQVEDYAEEEDYNDAQGDDNDAQGADYDDVDYGDEHDDDHVAAEYGDDHACEGSGGRQTDSVGPLHPRHSDNTTRPHSGRNPGGTSPESDSSIPLNRADPNRSTECSEARQTSNHREASRAPRGIGMGNLGKVNGAAEPEIGAKNKLQLLVGRLAPGEAVRDIGPLLRASWPGPYLSWASVPDLIQTNKWKKFKGMWYVPKEEDQAYYKAFTLNVTERYRSILALVRKAARKASNSYDIQEWVDHKPKWMNEPIWLGLLKKWSEPKWIKQSITNKKNRNTDKDGGVGKHSGGSVSFAEHALRMGAELGRPPTPPPPELFPQMHRGKAEISKFIDRRAQHAMDSYDALMLAKYGSPDAVAQAGFDLSVWKKAACAVKRKGWIYGIIQSKCLEYNAASMSNDVEGSRSAVVSAQVRVALDELRAELVDDIRKQLRDELREEIVRELRQQSGPSMDIPNVWDGAVAE